MTTPTPFVLLILVLSACAGGPTPGPQQPSSTLLPDWEYELVPYGWFQQTDGTQTIDGVTAPVDVEFADGDLAWGLHFGARQGRWGVLAEAMYLKADGTTPNAAGMSTTSEIEQILLEGDISYQIGADMPIEILGGLRYNHFDNSVAVVGGGTASGNEGWLDPILGARLVADFAERWSFLWRFDVGGFRIGSEFSWNTVAGFRYRASELVSVELVYRVLDIDYQTTDFAYDAQTSGAILGLGFHW